MLQTMPNGTAKNRASNPPNGVVATSIMVVPSDIGPHCVAVTIETSNAGLWPLSRHVFVNSLRLEDAFSELCSAAVVLDWRSGISSIAHF
jgi:hypothetical protein